MRFPVINKTKKALKFFCDGNKYQRSIFNGAFSVDKSLSMDT